MTITELKVQWNALIDAASDNQVIDYMVELGYFDWYELNGESIPTFEAIAERGYKDLTPSERKFIKGIIFWEHEKFGYDSFEFLTQTINDFREIINQ